MSYSTDILGLVHNLAHEVRCKALAKDSAEEAQREAARVQHWERLVTMVREADAMLQCITAQRDRLVSFGDIVAEALRDIAGDAHGVYLADWESAVSSVTS